MELTSSNFLKQPKIEKMIYSFLEISPYFEVILTKNYFDDAMWIGFYKNKWADGDRLFILLLLQDLWNNPFSPLVKKSRGRIVLEKNDVSRTFSAPSGEMFFSISELRKLIKEITLTSSVRFVEIRRVEIENSPPFTFFRLSVPFPITFKLEHIILSEKKKIENLVHAFWIPKEKEKEFSSASSTLWVDFSTRQKGDEEKRKFLFSLVPDK